MWKYIIDFPTPLALNQNMLTKIDLSLIKNVVKITIDEELDVKLDEKLDEKLGKLPTKDEFYGQTDKLMKELKDMREEHKMLSARVYEDHEPRIAKIEKKLQIQTA